MRKWLALAVLVIALDQLTKYAITQSLAFGEYVTIAPFFDLVLTYNTGAAFSFLRDASGWQHGFFITVALIVSAWIVYLLLRHPGSALFNLALGLVLGGALGNVIDRLRHGAVVDFLHFHIQQYSWPAFNVADSAITCGAALLIWDSFRGKEARNRDEKG